MVNVQKTDFESGAEIGIRPAQIPVISAQERAQRSAQVGIDRGKPRIERNEAGLSDAARLHFKKHEERLREMVIKGEDWRAFIRENRFYPPSVRKELIGHTEIIEQAALTGRLIGALATGMKPGEWKALPEAQRQDAIIVARHAAATIQEYAKKNNISADAAFDTLLKDDKFRKMLVAVGSPEFKAQDAAMRAAHGLTTDEGEKAKWMDGATKFVAAQARAAGFSESTIKAALADSTNVAAPSASLSPPAAVQMAQQQMMNVQMQRKDEERRERDELNEKLNEKERKKAALKKIAGQSEKAA